MKQRHPSISNSSILASV